MRPLPSRFLLAATAFFVVAAALIVASAGAGSRSVPRRAIEGRPIPLQLRAWLRHRDLATAAAATRRGSPAGRHSFFRDPVAPTVAVGGNPVAVAVAAATDTVYVGNFNDTTVSVVDGATCNATVTTGCGQSAPTVAVAPGPVGAVVDPTTNTVYVAGVAGNTVSVVDGNACNAQHPSGCSATPATITVGNGPGGLALNELTHTLYVANFGDNTVSVVRTATCNAEDTSGCNQAPATISVGGGPSDPAVNEATDTVYVPNFADGTVSVINGAICNAETSSGCGQTPANLSVGPNPAEVLVDQETDTVYEIGGPGPGAPTNLGWVSVINGATCNGRVTSGCGQVAPRVTVGALPNGLVEDEATKTIFVLSEEDPLSIIDGARCNAVHLSGCREPALSVSVGHNPAFLDINPVTHTVYVSNQDDNTISVLDADACTVTHLSGCRVAAPTTTVGISPQGIAADAATSTVYVSNRTDSNLSIIDARRCNAVNRSRCGQPWPTVATANGSQAVAVNQLTDTVYTADIGPWDGAVSDFSGGNTVSVIDGSSCNAAVTSGCGKPPATVTVGDFPFALAVNEATDTIYVASAGADFNGDTVSVIDGATCNGKNHTRCGSPVATVTVGHVGESSIAVDEATDTIYVVNGNDGTISMIDGATCNRTNQSGCGQIPPTFATGSPVFVAVEQAANTVYVANFFMNVWVIDGAICNARDQSGCSPGATLTAPDFITSMTVDQQSGAVFVDRNFEAAQVWAFDGSRCNARDTSGCAQTPAEVPVGGTPGPLATDPDTSTVYVADNTDGKVSLFGFARGIAFP